MIWRSVTVAFLSFSTEAKSYSTALRKWISAKQEPRAS